MGEVQGWEVRARCCSCSKVATGRKERDRERGRGGREGERGKREREERGRERKVNSRRVWYSMAMCTSVLICASPTWAGLGPLPLTHSHSATCLSAHG